MRNCVGEMKRSVGEMKQTVGETKRFVGEMKQIWWGDEATWWGNEAKCVGEMPHRQSEITPPSWSERGCRWRCRRWRSIILWRWLPLPWRMTKAAVEHMMNIIYLAIWRWNPKVQPMWLYILLSSDCLSIHLKTRNREQVKQMQPLWLCIFLCKCFE